MATEHEQDHYEVLGVAPSASSEEIRTAFRALVKKLHPDLHPDDPDADDRFKKVVMANEVLSDEAKRSQYDRGRNARRVRIGPDQAIKDMAETLFQDFLRRDKNPAAADGIPDPADPPWRSTGPFHGIKRRGKDVRISVLITLEEAVDGVEKTVESPGGKKKCDRCQGNGAEPGTPVLPCATCGGTGQVLNRSSATVCKNCRGYRTVPVKACKRCHGQGMEAAVRKVRLRVPSGVEDGTELRLAGQGEQGADGPGDLYVTVRLQDHPDVVRKGRDLYVTAEIPIKTAMLGGRAGATLLGRTVEFDVGPGAFLRGEPVVVRGGGIRPKLGSPAGDLHVRLAVDIGTPSARAVRLIEELDEEVRSRRPR